MNRSYYSASTSNYLVDSEDHILGVLATKHPFSLDQLQRNAWIYQIQLFKRLFANAPTMLGHLFFEFSIPRMGRRVDVIFTHRGIVFVLEFKVGEKKYPKHALDQVMDYCLDLKNFHSGSHKKAVVPVLVSTHAPAATNRLDRFNDQLYTPLKANSNNLLEVVSLAVSQVNEPDFDATAWAQAAYKPTPTIIEAAQALYKGHSVEEISRSDGGAINLTRTSNAIGDVINQAKSSSQKAICFITGVPGSGKTLAGLNIANQRHNIDEGEHAVFLSGNGPLVKVLQEALARDKVAYQKDQGQRFKKGDALAETKAFIQNIHHFRDDALESDLAPVEKVVVFDEAQRAWTVEQTANFMKQKKGKLGFDMSEPEFLISVMDRHSDYAVIVCLIGGGQEINTGEAGLPEWFDALSNHFPSWDVYVSDQLEDFEYNRGENLYSKIDPQRLMVRQDLHLEVSIRSFRAEAVSDLVKAILDGEVGSACDLFPQIKDDYPIVLTRDLDVAKKWLRSKARGTERYGIVASSGALRLKPLGLNLRAKIDPVNWFLEAADDVRSSYYLEDVATEFDVQGLELDWACVAWDGNFYRSGGNWIYRKFTGTTWKSINDETIRLYLKNSYRVLLTRARQGMVIWIPQGSADDPTRCPAFYDATFEYLKGLGFPVEQ